MKTIYTLLFLFSAAVLPASVASAGHPSPLEAAACSYHDAVKQFECTVRDVGFVDPCDQRLVHSLVVAACDLREAARYPTQIDQVLCQWREVRVLHRRVAAALFASSCYPQHPLLIKCWERVSCAYRELAKAVECACSTAHAYRRPIGGSYGTGFGFSATRHPLAGIPNAVIPGATSPYAAIPGAAIPRTPLPGATSPYAAIPRAAVPRTPLPGATLPPAFAPTTPRVDPRVRPNITPPQVADPLTDPIRYFGRRPYSYPRAGQHNVDAHFTANDPFGGNGNDIRSAMINALLSRLMQ